MLGHHPYNAEPPNFSDHRIQFAKHAEPAPAVVTSAAR